jgi:shikimate dehydrogenase
MTETIPILAVAGRPVLHSKSPVIFRELFRSSGTKGAYSRLAAGSAAEAISLFRALGMRGMNLTSPFKEEAAPLVDELSDRAQKLGAVNSLARAGGGAIRGDNTDPEGVLGALAARGAAVTGSRCLVLGAGGAGKAAAFALISAGAEVTIANRTRSRADDAAALLGCSSASLDELPALAAAADFIVSTIASDALPDPEAWMPPAGGRLKAVLDADYKTGALARLASLRGLSAATGADWLLSQALPAYRLFMGGEALDVDEAERARLAAILAAAPPVFPRGRAIALVGLMGAGKTRVGRSLAGRLGAPFVDADAEIEAEASASIPEIFAREGEAGFRAREARALDRITSREGTAVISTGGGAPTDPASASILAESCLPVWLYVSPRTAAARAAKAPGGAASRPLIAAGDPEERLAALEAERRGAYASLAELIVSTEGHGPEEVAEMIHDEISRVS